MLFVCLTLVDWVMAQIFPSSSPSPSPSLPSSTCTSTSTSTSSSFSANDEDVWFAGVEGGGTSWRVAVARGVPTNIVDSAKFDTEDPDTTLTKISEWLSKHKYNALGIATFGPIEPKLGKAMFGYITSTPKEHWDYTNVVGRLVNDSNKHIPFLFDTDVNAPAMAEYDHFGKAKGHSSCAYITVGTGVGVGLIINGLPVHGLLHPEGGHLLLQCDILEGNSTFEGTCRFHKNCVEGLVSAPALAKLAGVHKDNLSSVLDTHPVWDHAADVLASLCSTLLLLVSPERIVLSGGVMLRNGLLQKIHEKTLKKLNKYINNKTLLDRPEDIIQLSHWRDNSGIIGALVLAKYALDNKQGSG
eukprot:m.39391 g.39391  ORF g.39391 m.39391 type:complete len:357 (+) comp6863_c0_seq1:109-1179(+)